MTFMDRKELEILFGDQFICFKLYLVSIIHSTVAARVGIENSTKRNPYTTKMIVESRVLCCDNCLAKH